MVSRRTVFGTGLAAAASYALPTLGKSKIHQADFGKGFLWGVATAGHQIEGSNVNSDFYALETVKPTLFSETSGDACNSFELWRDDLDLIKSLGLNSYRFSIEWSRIEPLEGQFSIAMLDHYKAIIEGCRDRGITPLVTFSHWTVPIWFAAKGGWTQTDAPELFSRYCDRAARHFANSIGYAFTLNEANGLLIARAMIPPPVIAVQTAMLEAASKAYGVTNFIGGPAFGQILDMLPNMLKAHQLGKAAIKAARSDLPVGATLAVADDVAIGENSRRDEMRKIFYSSWLDNVKDDDFVGVQNYVRNRWDSKGKLPAEEGIPLSSEGEGVYPSSLAGAVAYIYEATKRPIMVTEHGVYTPDDTLRAKVIPAALSALKTTMDAGVPVIGYIHWSLMDNYEWTSGFKAKLGLATMDRTTFVRTPKPSAAIYSKIAKQNRV
jgi:beta-glucosidase